MTTYQFSAPHCYATRGDQRRGRNHTWSVVGGWCANNNSEIALQGWQYTNSQKYSLLDPRLWNTGSSLHTHSNDMQQMH